jgi:hypothetical protein
MKLSLRAAALAAGLSLVPSAASADERTPTAPPSGARWYGLPALVSDGAAFGLAMTGVALAGLEDCTVVQRLATAERCAPHTRTPEGFLAAGAAIYGLGGPLNHMLRGHFTSAGLSFGLRAAPLAIGLPMMAAGTDPGGGGLGALGLGITMLGTLAAMGVDDGVLAHEARAAPPTLSLSPQIDPRTGAASMLVQGAF